MIHWRFGVSIYAIGGEVSVPGIPLQQALALQVTGDTVRDGVRQMSEFITGWRFYPAKRALFDLKVELNPRPTGPALGHNYHQIQ